MFPQNLPNVVVVVLLDDTVLCVRESVPEEDTILAAAVVDAELTAFVLS